MPTYDYYCPGNGKTIEVFHGISRKLETWGELCELAGEDVGETSPDGRITLLEAECLGACGGAPMLVCGNQYFENLTTDKLDSLLDQLD